MSHETSMITGFAANIAEQLQMHPSLLAPDTSKTFMVGHIQSQLGDLVSSMDRGQPWGVTQLRCAQIGAALFALQQKMMRDV